MRPRPPRRDRWLSLIEVANIMKLENPKRDERRRLVRRAVQRAEKRDECRYTKRVGKSLYVSVAALETLLPYDAEAFSKLGRSVADIAQIQRDHGRQLNGIGARVRVVEKKVQNLAETDRALLRASEAHGEALGLIRANIGPTATAY